MIRMLALVLMMAPLGSCLAGAAIGVAGATAGAAVHVTGAVVGASVKTVGAVVDVANGPHNRDKDGDHHD